MGLDSHEKIKIHFRLKDDDNYCPCEISPKNTDYLNPDKWVFRFDDKIPDWWKKSHEKMSWEAFEEWKKQLDKILVKKPIIHPFRDIKPPEKITEKHIKLLMEWDSARDSVGTSVWDSVGTSVCDSVGDSVWAFIGSFFKLKRTEWKYTEKIKTKGYPFESAVKLWNMGLVVSFDGTTYRIHGGKDAKVMYEITKKDLMKLKRKIKVKA